MRRSEFLLAGLGAVAFPAGALAGKPPVPPGQAKKKKQEAIYVSDSLYPSETDPRLA